MNIKEALEVLELTPTKLTLQGVKKKYHKLSLKYHPDKNSAIDAKEKFQKINEAYSFLQHELGEKEEREEERETRENLPEYSEILSVFLQTIFNSENIKIIIRIMQGFITVKLFENIDKDSLLKIYKFLIDQKDLLHIHDSILEKVYSIILEKYESVCIIILNPTLKDLFENNIYKLLINEKPYYIPLWHSEIYLDTLDETIIKCVPELPENVEIDEDNNLLITVDIPTAPDFIHEKSISISIAGYEWLIPFENLYMRQTQNYTLFNRGISKINADDSFDVSEKANIVFHISFAK